MKRRALLKVGLLGGGLLAVAGSGLQLIPSRRTRSPRRPLRYLDATEFAILAAAAGRIITVVGADVVAIAHVVDGALEAVSPEARSDFRHLLRLLESALAGLLLDGRPMNFTRLGPAGQDAALKAFRDSSLVLRRTGYQALRKLCAASYYANETTWPAIGYPGPPTIPPGTHVDP